MKRRQARRPSGRFLARTDTRAFCAGSADAYREELSTEIREAAIARGQQAARDAGYAGF